MQASTTQHFTLSPESLQAIHTMHRETRSPCVSMLVGLDPATVERHANTLKLRAALKQARTQILGDDSLEQATQQALLANLKQLEPTDDRTYDASTRSVAMYVTSSDAITVATPRELEPMTTLSHRPFTLPLVTTLQHDESFYFLEVSEKTQRACFVTHGQMIELFTLSITDEPFALAADYADPRDSPLQSHGGAGAGAPIYHGHASKKADHDADRLMRFYRAGSQKIFDHLKSRGAATVVLMGVERQRVAFLESSQEGDLYTVQLDPIEGASPGELREHLERVLGERAPQHDRVLKAWERNAARNLTEVELEVIGERAAQGMIEMLVVRADTPVWGEFDELSGKVSVHKEQKGSELRDALAARVVELGGSVHVLAAERMPADAPIIATLRGRYEDS